MPKLLALLVVALLTGAIALPDTARAHAAYKDSEPADKSTVGSPPSRVTAEFTEPLAGGSFLQITDACGDRVDSGDVSIVGYEMSVSMSGSKSGRYSVFYRAHSQLDPHVVEGTFTFTATSGSSCPSDEAAPRPADETEPEREAGGDGPSSTNRQVDLAQGPSRGSRGGGGGARGPERASAPRSSSPPPGRPPSSAQVPNLVAPEEDEQADRPSVYEGIPLGPFLAGLLLAALIGAGGGKIYAGIMGPRA